MPITASDKEQQASTKQPRRSGRQENLSLTAMCAEKISRIEKHLNNLDIERHQKHLEKKT